MVKMVKIGKVKWWDGKDGQGKNGQDSQMVKFLRCLYDQVQDGEKSKVSQMIRTLNV